MKQLKRHDRAYKSIGPVTMLLVISAACWGLGSCQTPWGSAEEYFVVGGEGFCPGSDVNYYNTYGCGGAYIVSGSGALVAPVHLPQGVTVTGFKVFFYDDSSSDLHVWLEKHNLESCGYQIMGEVSSSGISGYNNLADNTIYNPTIDNTHWSYNIYAYCDTWDNHKLRIKGAVITYKHSWPTGVNETPIGQTSVGESTTPILLEALHGAMGEAGLIAYEPSTSIPAEDITKMVQVVVDGENMVAEENIPALIYGDTDDTDKILAIWG